MAPASFFIVFPLFTSHWFTHQHLPHLFNVITINNPTRFLVDPDRLPSLVELSLSKNESRSFKLNLPVDLTGSQSKTVKVELSLLSRLLLLQVGPSSLLLE